MTLESWSNPAFLYLEIPQAARSICAYFLAIVADVFFSVEREWNVEAIGNKKGLG